MVDDDRWNRFTQKREAITALRSWAKAHRQEGKSYLDRLSQMTEETAAAEEWMPTCDLALPEIGDALLAEAMTAVRIEAKYGGYILRQQREIERFRRMESRHIPADFNYAAIPHLRNEAKEKFTAMTPPLRSGL